MNNPNYPKPKSWRDSPCSPKQSQLLLDLGFKTLPETRGEASDLITDELTKRGSESYLNDALEEDEVDDETIDPLDGWDD